MTTPETREYKAQIAELKFANANLTAEIMAHRRTLARIIGYAETWIEQLKRTGLPVVRPSVVEKLQLIHAAASVQPKPIGRPAGHAPKLTTVMVGGSLYTGTLIEDADTPFPNWASIEVLAISPGQARMSVDGPVVKPPTSYAFERLAVDDGD